MTISTEAQLVSCFNSAKRMEIYKNSLTSFGTGTYHSLYAATGIPAGATSNPPTGAGEFPTNATVGIFPTVNAASGAANYIGRCSLRSTVQSTLIIYDRIWHDGGLDFGASITRQVNSTTLPRNSDGLGLELFLEANTALSIYKYDNATLTCVFKGVGGVQQTVVMSLPMSTTYPIGEMFKINTTTSADGCTGVISSDNGSNLNKGSYGYVILRRLVEIPLLKLDGINSFDHFCLGLPALPTDACLCGMVLCTGTSTGYIQGSIDIIEG